MFLISKTHGQQSMTTQRTVELPDDLAERLEQYLQEHPGETLSSLVMDVLEMKLHPRDLSELLALSGIVTKSPRNAGERAEDLV
jgi:metal-responsive CopG/Arc/MetJ family transcriptional regulator